MITHAFVISSIYIKKKKKVVCEESKKGEESNRKLGWPTMETKGSNSYDERKLLGDVFPKYLHSNIPPRFNV